VRLLRIAGTDRAHYIDAFYANKTGHGLSRHAQLCGFSRTARQYKIDAVIIATPDHCMFHRHGSDPSGQGCVCGKAAGVSVVGELGAAASGATNRSCFQYARNSAPAIIFGRRALCAQWLTWPLHTIHAWCTDIHSQESAFTAINGYHAAHPGAADLIMTVARSGRLFAYTADRCTPVATYHTMTTRSVSSPAGALIHWTLPSGATTAT
jgi:hypothetical protein